MLEINVEKFDYRESFEKLKLLIIINDPILTYPDFTKDFTLKTDASNFALGTAVLFQSSKQICFTNRTLIEHDVNYSTVEKEWLAIVWATKQFRQLFIRKKTHGLN